MRKFFWTTLTSLSLLILLVSHSAPIFARETNFAGQDPSVQALIIALNPVKANKQKDETQRVFARSKTRALNLAAVPEGLLNDQENIAPPPEKTVAVAEEIARASFDQIRFEFGSDRLTPKAEKILERIAEALSSPQLSEHAYTIEGHTDAAGSDAYNLSLSQRRAQAVRQYLVTNFGILPNRLKPVGKGKKELLDSKFPQSLVNRRVVFVS